NDNEYYNILLPGGWKPHSNAGEPAKLVPIEPHCRACEDFLNGLDERGQGDKHRLVVACTMKQPLGIS
ncbi:MAG: hypothetical protein ACREAW_00405, partial [Nitrososphaera sp.]